MIAERGEVIVPIDYDGICYKRTFLKTVIARVDFGPQALPIDNASLPQDLRKSIEARFQIAEPQTVVEESLQFGGPTVKRERTEGIQWVFHNAKRTKTLSVTDASLQATYRSFDRYEDLRTDVMEVISALGRIIPGMTATRLGLRYVNVFTLGTGDPFAWSSYFHPALVASFAFPTDNGVVSRALGVFEYNFGDVNLRMQYGVANPDYPAPIRRRQFILDLDGYFAGLLDRQQLGEVLDSAHKRIQETFEGSITEAVREAMNAP